MFTYFQEAYNSLLQYARVNQSASWLIHELVYPQATGYTVAVISNSPRAG